MPRFLHEKRGILACVFAFGHGRLFSGEAIAASSSCSKREPMLGAMPATYAVVRLALL